MIAIRLLVEGAVVREAVFPDDRTLVIGRAAESDFVLLDPTVSRVHARVQRGETGELWIEDAGSRHGLEIGAARVIRAAVPRAGPLRCRLGSIELELVQDSGDVTLEMPRPVPPAPAATRALQFLAFWAAGVAAWVAALVVEPSFWSPWDHERLSDVAWVALGTAVALPVLAFVLVGLLRIARRQAHLVDTLRALAAVSWGWLTLELLTLATTYVLSVSAHAALETLLQQGALVLSLAYLASLARPGPRARFFWSWVAMGGVLVVALAAVGRLAARQTGTPDLDYDVAVPVRGFTGPATDLDRYLDRVRADFEDGARAAEAERLRAVRD